MRANRAIHLAPYIRKLLDDVEGVPPPVSGIGMVYWMDRS
jgi:hypothetical protein